jgi:hypothetical protein
MFLVGFALRLSPPEMTRQNPFHSSDFKIPSPIFHHTATMGLKLRPHEISWAAAVKLQYRETRAQESARPRPHLPREWNFRTHIKSLCRHTRGNHPAVTPIEDAARSDAEAKSLVKQKHIESMLRLTNKRAVESANALPRTQLHECRLSGRFQIYDCATSDSAPARRQADRSCAGAAAKGFRATDPGVC